MRTIVAGSLLLTLFACSTPQESPSAKEIQIDLDRAIEVALPGFTHDLQPVSFKTADGREGWAVRLPGNLPIATPAIWEGMLFVGGGYGSHEFYAFDAKTGAIVWKMQTADDGPTAAVVEDGLVAFNTESCTVIVAEARTGKIVWQEWLGDPLMSQPAIWKGHLYIAYPAGQRGNPGKGHRLLCADLRTGKHLWEQEISGDVISAPVVDEGRLFFTCFNGTSFCLDAEQGAVVWKKENAGTSAPLVVAGEVVVTENQTVGGKKVEGIRRLDAKAGEAKDKELLAKGQAKHLEKDKGGGVALSTQHAQVLDSGVGFATAPAAAGLSGANDNLGVQSVARAWAYQGARAACNGDTLFNCQSTYLNRVNKDGQLEWRATMRGRDVKTEMQTFSPPALGKQNMYLASAAGHLLSVRQGDGAVSFAYAMKHPMAFQPALADGNMYVGTTNGVLVCLKTGDKDCDGWTMWGGNAQHNKK